MTPTNPIDGPPRWAEAWLRSLLPPRDRDTVTGDLLEEYRENIRPRRSALASDFWYLGQVLTFTRPLALCATALAAVYVSRTALDWFSPPADFGARAQITTWIFFSGPLAIGFLTGWRTRSASTGGFGTLTALTFTAIGCATVNGLMVALWHDPQTLAAIERSGGLVEVFALPFLIIVPGTLDGWIGGTAGKWAVSAADQMIGHSSRDNC